MSDLLKEKLTALPMGLELAAALLADRCRREPQLADRLRDDPRACLEKLGNRNLPENIKIITHDNTDDTWHLPLPSHSEDGVLSEEQLEKLSAGELWVAGLVIGGGSVLLTGAIVGAIIGAGFLRDS